MKIYNEQSLRNFNFWSGAKDNAAVFTDEQLDTLEAILEDCEPAEGWSDTQINDLFWFESDTLAEWLGFENLSDLEAANVRAIRIKIGKKSHPAEFNG